MEFRMAPRGIAKQPEMVKEPGMKQSPERAYNHLPSGGEPFTQIEVLRDTWVIEGAGALKRIEEHSNRRPLLGSPSPTAEIKERVSPAVPEKSEDNTYYTVVTPTGQVKIKHDGTITQERTTEKMTIELGKKATLLFGAYGLGSFSHEALFAKINGHEIVCFNYEKLNDLKLEVRKSIYREIERYYQHEVKVILNYGHDLTSNSTNEGTSGSPRKNYIRDLDKATQQHIHKSYSVRRGSPSLNRMKKSMTHARIDEQRGIHNDMALLATFGRMGYQLVGATPIQDYFSNIVRIIKAHPTRSAASSSRDKKDSPIRLEHYQSNKGREGKEVNPNVRQQAYKFIRQSSMVAWPTTGTQASGGEEGGGASEARSRKAYFYFPSLEDKGGNPICPQQLIMAYASWCKGNDVNEVTLVFDPTTNHSGTFNPVPPRVGEAPPQLKRAKTIEPQHPLPQEQHYVPARTQRQHHQQQQQQFGPACPPYQQQPNFHAWGAHQLHQPHQLHQHHQHHQHHQRQQQVGPAWTQHHQHHQHQGQEQQGDPKQPSYKRHRGNEFPE